MADLIERLREAGVAASDGHAFGRPDTEDVLWWIDKHADKVLRVLLEARLEEVALTGGVVAVLSVSRGFVTVPVAALLSLLAPEVPR